LQVVILAGGLGTRLRPLTENIPKPMVSVAGRPFLEYELRYLRKNGFKEFLICVGYRSSVIEDYFQNGSALNIFIAYSEDGERQLGPAGALKKACGLLEPEFMVTYGDAFLRLNYDQFIEGFHSSGKLGMMAVLENHDNFGKSDLVVEKGMISKYDKSNSSPEMIWINYGATLLKEEALQYIPEGRVVGEEEFYAKLIRKKELAAFPTFQRFYEIGTIPGLTEFEKFLAKNSKLFEN
jgi:NDP-sugar pyrophosphorylase family protein